MRNWRVEAQGLRLTVRSNDSFVNGSAVNNQFNRNLACGAYARPLKMPAWLAVPNRLSFRRRLRLESSGNQRFYLQGGFLSQNNVICADGVAVDGKFQNVAASVSTVDSAFAQVINPALVP